MRVSNRRRPHLTGVRNQTAALVSVLARTLEGSLRGHAAHEHEAHG
jgi:hypothetical protein